MEHKAYTGCVYIATNIANGKCYIGKSLHGVDARRKSHYSGARNGSTFAFARAIRKHGEKNFAWQEVYLSDDDAALMSAEVAIILSAKGSGIRLYNLTEGGDGARRKRSEKEIAAMRGRVNTDATKARMAAAWDEERRAAQADKMRNRAISEGARAIGRKAIAYCKTPEALAKMAESKRGKKMAPWTPERRAKMEAAWATGCCTKSDETKAKIRATKRAQVTDEVRAKLKAQAKLGAQARWGKP